MHSLEFPGTALSLKWDLALHFHIPDLQEKVTEAGRRQELLSCHLQLQLVRVLRRLYQSNKKRLWLQRGDTTRAAPSLLPWPASPSQGPRGPCSAPAILRFAGIHATTCPKAVRSEGSLHGTARSWCLVSRDCAWYFTPLYYLCSSGVSQ